MVYWEGVQMVFGNTVMSCTGVMEGGMKCMVVQPCLDLEHEGLAALLGEQQVY
jgi:hypothetical protein